MIDIFLIIFEQTLLHLPLVFGAYISISLMKIPDLSLESAYVFGAILGSQALFFGKNFPLPILCILVLGASLLGGALVGLVSSLITQKGGVPHLLSSIITIGLFHGINQLLIQSYRSLSGYPNPLNLFALIPKHPELFMVGIIACIITGIMFLLFKTQLGYSLFVFGNNSQFFKCYGISTIFVGITGVVISNALAGCSGYLFAQSNGFVEINMGMGKILLCITALIMGKVFKVTTKPISILMPLVGTLSYFTLQQLLLKVGFNLKYFTAVQAALILLLLLVFLKKSSFRRKIDHLGI